MPASFFFFKSPLLLLLLLHLPRLPRRDPRLQLRRRRDVLQRYRLVVERVLGAVAQVPYDKGSVHVLAARQQLGPSSGIHGLVSFQVQI